jgi:hypothetical protein
MLDERNGEEVEYGTLSSFLSSRDDVLESPLRLMLFIAHQERLNFGFGA